MVESTVTVPQASAELLANADTYDDWIEGRDYKNETVATMFRQSVERFSERDAVGERVKLSDTEYGDHYVYKSYRDMGAETDEITKVLDKLGVSMGDTVALYALNKPRWTETDIAIKLRGAITVPLYSTLGPERLQYVLVHCCAQVVFCDAHYLPRLLGSAHLCPDLRAVICLQDFDEAEVLTSARDQYVHADAPANEAQQCFSEARLSLYTINPHTAHSSDAAPDSPEETQATGDGQDLAPFMPWGEE
ncbi:hypothetical protein KIPB_010092, partial [Kipferlia bialata]|eukprot:g10092.t1